MLVKTSADFLIKTTPAAVALVSDRHTVHVHEQSSPLQKMKKVCPSNRVKGQAATGENMLFGVGNFIPTVIKEVKFTKICNCHHHNRVDCT